MSDDHVEEVAAEEVEVEEEAPMSVLDALKEVRLVSLTFWCMLCKTSGFNCLSERE